MRFSARTVVLASILLASGCGQQVESTAPGTAGATETPASTATAPRTSTDPAASDLNIESAVARAFQSPENLYASMTATCRQRTDEYGGVEFLRTYWVAGTKVTDIKVTGDSAAVTVVKPGQAPSVDTWIKTSGGWKSQC